MNNGVQARDITRTVKSSNVGFVNDLFLEKTKNVVGIIDVDRVDACLAVAAGAGSSPL